MSLMSDKEMHFQVPLKTFRHDGQVMQQIWQWVPNCRSRRLRKPKYQMCCDETAEYSVCDGWPNGGIGGWKLRRLACSSGLGTSELGTEDTNKQTWRGCMWHKMQGWEDSEASSTPCQNPEFFVHSLQLSRKKRLHVIILKMKANKLTGIMRIFLFRRSSSAASVVGPLAASATICRIWLHGCK